MRQLFDFCRTILVSFEFLFLLTVSVVAFWWPHLVLMTGEVLKSQPEVLKWIPALPLSLCAIAFGSAWKLTTPLSISNRELLDWPDYWRLKLRRNVSMFLSALIAVAIASIWIFSPKIEPFWFGYIFVTAIGVSLINVGCMTMAALALREIMEK